ncbi:DNA circularization protein [Kingella oralis]|uniref:DNA circularization protein n=1 Tax=Kingella oralis TaxID=505 RepID=UPI0034E4CD2A
MSMWHTVLQDASFRDVRFDVVALDEQDGKALVEHARPFTDGVWLEDMGSTGRQVQVEAVFWGKGYHSRLNALVEALMERGAGVLVHPVWGRLQNMMAASWHFHHDADNVDYATLSITFRESGEPQKIFVFENAFLMAIERLIARIDTYRAALEGWIDALTMAKQSVGALIGSAFGFASAARGAWAALRDLFDVGSLGLGGHEGGGAGDGTGSKTLWREIHSMVQAGLFQATAIGADGAVHTADVRSAKSRFDALLRAADAVATVEQRMAVAANSNTRRGSDWAERAQVGQVLRLMALETIFQAALLLLEHDGERMSAPDVWHINRAVRQRTAAEIARLRETLAAMPDKAQAYDAVYAVVETLRDAAAHLNLLAVAALNQKPPLIARPAPLNGTVHQLAFAWYSDIARADELIRLNPQLRHPCFIQQGELMNGYAK